ncbi:MAG TPA: helix-turn-helix domain-containing protein [candidate division Zixibacteria bacterium]|nr:helix-turn-helix domain-containing protein [candidate division Zixibacteria bacterium]
MVRSKEIAARVVELAIEKKLAYAEAAELLEVSARTIHNYVKKYLKNGKAGLIDHRRGRCYKLTPEMKQRIINCKAERPHRSARWIRDRLKLNVSPEAVRQVLVKHRLEIEPAAATITSRGRLFEGARTVPSGADIQGAQRRIG